MEGREREDSNVLSTRQARLMIERERGRGRERRKGEERESIPLLKGL